MSSHPTTETSPGITVLGTLPAGHPSRQDAIMSFSAGDRRNRCCPLPKQFHGQLISHPSTPTPYSAASGQQIAVCRLERTSTCPASPSLSQIPSRNHPPVSGALPLSSAVSGGAINATSPMPQIQQMARHQNLPAILIVQVATASTDDVLSSRLLITTTGNLSWPVPATWRLKLRMRITGIDDSQRLHRPASSADNFPPASASLWVLQVQTRRTPISLATASMPCSSSDIIRAGQRRAQHNQQFFCSCADRRIR